MVLVRWVGCRARGWGVRKACCYEGILGERLCRAMQGWYHAMHTSKLITGMERARAPTMPCGLHPLPHSAFNSKVHET